MRRLIWPLRCLTRPLLATVAVTLAFAPALIRAEGVHPSSRSVADQTEQVNDSSVTLVLRQIVPVAQEDEIPDWVWGVIGGSAGAALAAAAGYSAWLRRRGRD